MEKPQKCPAHHGNHVVRLNSAHFWTPRRKPVLGEANHLSLVSEGKKLTPGNSAGDLFGMVSSRNPFQWLLVTSNDRGWSSVTAAESPGCWWCLSGRDGCGTLWSVASQWPCRGWDLQAVWHFVFWRWITEDAGSNDLLDCASDGLAMEKMLSATSLPKTCLQVSFASQPWWRQQRPVALFWTVSSTGLSSRTLLQRSSLSHRLVWLPFWRTLVTTLSKMPFQPTMGILRWLHTTTTTAAPAALLWKEETRSSQLDGED